MVEIEVPWGSFGNEKLRVVRVVVRFRHREEPGSVVLQIDVELIVERTQRRAAGTDSGGVTALDDEVIDHTMKNKTIVEAALGQPGDLASRPRRPLLKKLENHIAEARHVDPHATVPLGDGGRNELTIAGGGERQCLTARLKPVERNMERRAR